MLPCPRRPTRRRSLSRRNSPSSLSFGRRPSGPLFGPFPRRVGLPRRRSRPRRAPTRRHLIAWPATKAERGCVNTSYFSLSLLSLINGPEFYLGWSLCSDPWTLVAGALLLSCLRLLAPPLVQRRSSLRMRQSNSCRLQYLFLEPLEQKRERASIFFPHEIDRCNESDKLCRARNDVITSRDSRTWLTAAPTSPAYS